MLLVRKTLTEVLLEVTDEKIQEISSETLSKYRKKGICAIKNYFYKLLNFFLKLVSKTNASQPIDDNYNLELNINL